MVSVLSLLVPIALSAVLVFIASSIIHMATPWHKNDLKKVPNEDVVMNALRAFNIPPGEYGFPKPDSMKHMGTPEFQAKYKAGPVAFLTVRPSGDMGMSRNLVMWFIYCAVVGFFAAYLASHTLPKGAPYLNVFRIVGATAFIGYSVALWQSSIWYQRSWLTTLKLTIDGLIYALLTAGVFGWLWAR